MYCYCSLLILFSNRVANTCTSTGDCDGIQQAGSFYRKGLLGLMVSGSQLLVFGFVSDQWPLSVSWWSMQ